MPVYKESQDEKAFKQNLNLLKDAVHTQAPKLQKAGQYGAEEKKAVETAKQLIKIGEQVHDTRERLMHARAELTAAKSPTRTEEVFSGATSMFVGAVAYGASTVQTAGIVTAPLPSSVTEESAKKASELRHDAGEVFSRGSEYLVGAQPVAYKAVWQDVQNVEKATNEFYATFNNAWGDVFEGKPGAQQKLVASLENLQAAWSKLETDMAKHKEYVAEVAGVVGVSKEFVVEATKEVAITLLAAKGLEIAFKAAEPLIVKGVTKVLSPGKAVETVTAATQLAETGAEAAVMTARVVGTAARVEEAAMLAGRVERTAAVAARGAQYAEKGLHTAHNVEALHAAAEKHDEAAYAEIEGVSISRNQTVFNYAAN